MQNTQQKLAPLFDQLLPEDGVREGAIPGLRIFRISEPVERTAMSYEPQIIILVQGRKTIYLGAESYLYDPLNYVVLSVPLPLECVVETPADEPVLGISILVNPVSIGEILLEDQSIRMEGSGVPKGIYSAPLRESMLDATYRLLNTLTNERDARILGPLIIREILYRVLCAEHGWALQALALQNRGFFQIARILQKIQKTYDTQMDIKSLAREAGMSPTSFHTSFKHITGNSPLQYIKNIRLHKARIFMSQEGLNAYAAAQRVGYESPSQFNREYKRLFGT
ncbi:MAG: AraC family transcriptional regulator, partial [Leptospiraceae bacterium]|nr:AraC family transcriptional regulator [Leptospiraceae bacterium]